MASSHQKEMQKLKDYVENKFHHIREALGVREKLLLRQIDAIATSTQQMARFSPTAKVPDTACMIDSNISQQELRFIVDNEDELLTAIRSFGRFNLDSINLVVQDMYMRNEDYITPTNDHEIMHKCLQADQLLTKTRESDSKDQREADDLNNQEAITVDFSKNKSLIENNVSNLNESIVNITAAEAKELIYKAKNKRSINSIPSLNLEEINNADNVDDDIDTTSNDASHMERQKRLNVKLLQSRTSGEAHKKTKKQRFKPNITINSCNGTINLGNVENLVINCSNEEATSSINDTDSCASSTGTTSATPAMESKIYSGTNSSTNSANSGPQSQKLNHPNDVPKVDNNNRSQIRRETDLQNLAEKHNHADNTVHCEFYNRLLNEIKNQLKEKSLKANERSLPKVITLDGNLNLNNHNCAHHHNPSAINGKRLILKNFDNLKIVLESNGICPNGATAENFHPVQIEQWLADIMSETDLEPMQNTDILEHSLLHEKDVALEAIHIGKI